MKKGKIPLLLGTNYKKGPSAEAEGPLNQAASFPMELATRASYCSWVSSQW